MSPPALSRPALESLSASAALSPGAHAALRRRMIFDHHKWDPQVGDVAVIAPYALEITAGEWQRVGRLALQLHAELLEAEAALLESPAALSRLSLPWPIRKLLGSRLAGAPTRGIARYVRFDFHATPEGWRISEANSDVPGGILEGSALGPLFRDASGSSDRTLPGDPGAAIADAYARALPSGARIGLVHATAYNDDRQVMVSLADRLRERGLVGIPCGPHDLRWPGGRARLADGPLDALFRFFPAEWLPSLFLGGAWWKLFRGGLTPVANPGIVLATQSKRFPLAWDALGLPMRAWRELLPETRDPREVDLESGDWVLKPVLGRVGEGVTVPGIAPLREWRAARRAALRAPREWVAQRSFEIEPVATPEGPMYPCLGVFVIDGAVSGAYARLAKQPRIDATAREAAVLVRPSSPALVRESGAALVREEDAAESHAARREESRHVA